jgi:hypothetical protein
LTLEHVIGFTLWLTASRNTNGYEISSQNYFRALNPFIDEPLEPARHQSISEARAKLGWQAFECLLGEANLESQRLPGRLTFRGHLTRAIDGTSFYTPRTDELLEYFSPRTTCSEEGETHYPYGLMVSAVNVYTSQPVAAQVGDHLDSERDLLLRLMKGFEPGDLSLLDRGLGGARVYLEFERLGQFFIHRAQSTGERSTPGYVREFIESGKKQKTLEIPVWDKKHRKQEAVIRIRLIRGPDDADGKPIVFATNLLDQNRYPRREIIGLYRKRWSVETHYGRVKHLLCLEKFHARSYNGVLQEVFANLLILSLTALAVTAVVVEDKVDADVELPNFKNASESVRRHLFAVIDRRIEGVKPKKLMKQILSEVRSVMYPIRPGRSYPRVSMQPIQSWNLKKSAKLRAFVTQQKTAKGPLRRTKSKQPTAQGPSNA